MKKTLRIAFGPFRRLPRRWVAATGGALLLCAGGGMLWVQHTWTGQLQRELATVLADTPYRLTLEGKPYLRWGWTPRVMLPAVVLTPLHTGPWPPVRLADAALKLHWWGTVTGFEAERAELAFATPLTFFDLTLASLTQQEGLALAARFGPATHPQPVLLHLGPDKGEGRALLFALGGLEAAGIWRTTATGGILDLPRLKLEDATGSGRLHLHNNRIGGALQFDTLRLSSSAMPGAILRSLRPALDPITLSAGRLELGGVTLRTFSAELNASQWHLRAGQGPRAITASGDWYADADGWGLPKLRWESRSMLVTGKVTGPAAATPEIGVMLAASRLDLAAPRGEINTLRLLDWLRSRTTPVRITLAESPAQLPLLPTGTLAGEVTFSAGTLAILRGNWQTAKGDALALTGSIALANLFPKLDLQLEGARAAQPDRISLHLTGPATHPELAATLMLQETQSRITGTFNFLHPKNPFQGNLALTGPAGDKLQGKLQIKDGGLVLQDLTASFQGVPLSGTLRLDPRGALPQLAATLHTPKATLEQVGKLAALGASGWGIAACSSAKTPLPPFSSKLNLTITHLPLAMGSLHQANVFLEGYPSGVQGRLNSLQGQIDLNLPYHLPHRTASRPADTRAGPARLHLALRKIPLTQTSLVRNGTLDLAGTLMNPAPCAADWGAQLGGPLRFRLQQGQLGGIDLGWLNTRIATSGLASLLNAETRRTAIGPAATTRLPDLSGRITLGGGTAQLAPVTWRSPGQTAALSGNFNVSSEKIDLDLIIKQETPSGLLPLMLGIHGPLAKPEINLQGREALGGALGQNILQRIAD
jgi:hypothetical protein